MPIMGSQKDAKVHKEFQRRWRPEQPAFPKAAPKPSQQPEWIPQHAHGSSLLTALQGFHLPWGESPSPHHSTQGPALTSSLSPCHAHSAPATRASSLFLQHMPGKVLPQDLCMCYSSCLEPFIMSPWRPFPNGLALWKSLSTALLPDPCCRFLEAILSILPQPCHQHSVPVRVTDLSGFAWLYPV